MTQPLGNEDFFSLEAGEYLDRLGALVAGPTAPTAEEVVRFTRALRGSALMANQAPVARAASGLEHLLRGYRDGRRAWDDDLAELTRDAVATLKVLVSRVRTWSAEDSAQAERLALQLETAAGGSRPITVPTPALSDSGVRAFLAREAAAVGSVLDQAARGAASPASNEVAQAILRRMQPLRGLAALADYPPLPELLDGVERTVAELSRLEISPASGSARLRAAATALARAARDVAERGRPDPEGAEFRNFAELLSAPEESESPVVPIESLFFDNEEGVVERHTLPRTPLAAEMAAAMVVSRGEHLCQAADEILKASSAAQRDVRLHVLLGDLRTLTADFPAGLAQPVEAFATAARAAISRGAAARTHGRFAALITTAGELLRGFTNLTQPAAVADALRPPIEGLGLLGTSGASLAVTAPRPGIEALPQEPEAAAVPIDTLLDDESDVVPIESLVYETSERASRPQPASRPVPTTVPATGTDGWDLAASISLYESLIAGGAVAAPMTAPAPAFVSAPAAEPAIVDITTLCYRGRAAVDRAAEVRQQLRAVLTASSTPTAIQPLVDELADLVELAFAD